MNVLNSRRAFLKGSILASLALVNANAFYPNSQQMQEIKISSYFIVDKHLSPHYPRNADKTLIIDKDISPIYSELKEAFGSQSLLRCISEEASFFVLSTMARDYQMRVIFHEKQDDIHHYLLAPKGVKL